MADVTVITRKLTYLSIDDDEYTKYMSSIFKVKDTAKIKALISKHKNVDLDKLYESLTEYEAYLRPSEIIFNEYLFDELKEAMESGAKPMLFTFGSLLGVDTMRELLVDFYNNDKNIVWSDAFCNDTYILGKFKDRMIKHYSKAIKYSIDYHKSQEITLGILSGGFYALESWGRLYLPSSKYAQYSDDLFAEASLLKAVILSK